MRTRSESAQQAQDSSRYAPRVLRSAPNLCNHQTSLCRTDRQQTFSPSVGPHRRTQVTIHGLQALEDGKHSADIVFISSQETGTLALTSNIFFCDVAVADTLVVNEPLRPRSPASSSAT